MTKVITHTHQKNLNTKKTKPNIPSSLFLMEAACWNCFRNFDMIPKFNIGIKKKKKKKKTLIINRNTVLHRLKSGPTSTWKS